jgi:hypothetical protein
MQLIALLLPLAVSAASLQSRQAAAGAPVAGIEELKPVFRAAARRTLTKYGRGWAWKSLG